MGDYKKIPVKINGKEYHIACTEEEEYIQRVAYYIDRKLNQILNANPRLDVSMASILMEKKTTRQNTATEHREAMAPRKRENLGAVSFFVFRKTKTSATMSATSPKTIKIMCNILRYMVIMLRHETRRLKSIAANGVVRKLSRMQFVKPNKNHMTVNTVSTNARRANSSERENETKRANVLKRNMYGCKTRNAHASRRECLLRISITKFNPKERRRIVKKGFVSAA